MPSPAFPQDSVLNKGHSGHGSAPALCQLHPCEHRRERWIGDQRQEQPVLSTGIDPAEVGTRVFSRCTNDHTAREGSWYVLVRQDEYVCLNQIRTIDHRRLFSKLGQIDTDHFR